MMAKRDTSPVEQRYSVDQVADLLTVSTQTIARYRESGLLLPAERLRGKWIFPASTINQFLASRRVAAA